MKTLLIDNYDSFTFNLYQACAELSGSEPLVIRNDELDWCGLKSLDFDVVIISPGPGHPAGERDFGICGRVTREIDAPLLGVCLGHQGICCSFGGTVTHAPEPVHGRLSRIRHDGTGLFQNVKPEFEAVRYHSLVATRPLPDCLEVIAETVDGLVMGLRHRSRPIWGVQFHPESICTSEGKQILANFYCLSAAALGTPWPDSRPNTTISLPAPRPKTAPKRRIFVRDLAFPVEPETAFRTLFADKPYSFWLDSSKAGGWGGHFSFMGAADGESREIISYRVREQQLSIRAGTRTRVQSGDLFEYLSGMLGDRHLDSDLPFDFNGGYVGYFGYELKADCGGSAVHEAPHPDAMLLFADRQIVFDHRDRSACLVWCGAPESERDARQWFARMEESLRNLPAPAPQILRASGDLVFTPVQCRDRYVANILRCLDYIRDGESYEICLTNKLKARTEADPLDYYESLRLANPAPYSAFMRLGTLAVACSSPEQFLRIDRAGTVQTKPIKGTAPRGRTAAEDEFLKHQLQRDIKSRAENLMIVDLLRNDLSRVCKVGTVHVPDLMNVETYATVHQLVSTVTGQLRPDASAVDCLRRAFPGGSMTGAPKLRTLEIIDGLEDEARGVYSGSIGFLALNGAAEMNIVIRTAVFNGGEVSIGTGGAIVALSEPEQEWNEILLKTKALTGAFQTQAPGRTRAESLSSLAAG